MKIQGLSVVIPAYNEAGGISRVIHALAKTLPEIASAFEILVVDDGSQDNTRGIAAAAGVVTLAHTHSMGYGAALKTGIRHAQHPWIMIIDADGSYPPESAKLLAQQIDESTDMVVGARIGKGAYTTPVRMPAKWVLKKLAQYLTGETIPDLNSGMRIFRKELALRFMHILPAKFSFTTTITLAALSNDYIVKYCPIEYRKRVGTSKIKPVQDTAYFLTLIVRTILYFNPLKIFVPLSLLLFAAAGITFFWSKLIFGKVADLTVLLLCLGGIQIIVTGLLADLIDKRISRG